MTNINLTRLKALTTAIHSVLVLLMVGALGFQIYAFLEYKNDVRENREVLCKSKAIADSEYCLLFHNSDGNELVTKDR